jgi:hypothetical protein
VQRLRNDGAAEALRVLGTANDDPCRYCAPFAVTPETKYSSVMYGKPSTWTACGTTLTGTFGSSARARGSQHFHREYHSPPTHVTCDVASRPSRRAAVNRRVACSTSLLLLFFVLSIGLNPLAQAVAPPDESATDESAVDEPFPGLQEHLDGMADRIKARVDATMNPGQPVVSTGQAVTVLAASLAAWLLYGFIYRRLVTRARARILQVDAGYILTRWGKRSAAGSVISLAPLFLLIVFRPEWLGMFDADHPYLSVTVRIFAFGLCALGMVLLFRVYRLCRQRVDDLAAADVYAWIVAGQTPLEPYILYLRPFASTNAVHVIVRINYKSTMTVELEEELAIAVRPIGHLITLGESLEHFGAGRIVSSEAGWQEAARRLIHHAALIIVLPSTRPGTLWEIEYLLANGYMRKTVFLDVPNIRVASSHFAQQTEWAGVGALVTASGYQWPADSPEGALIFFGTSKTPQIVEPLNLRDTPHLREAIGRIRELAERSAVA